MADKKKLDLPKDKVRVRLVLNDLYDSTYGPGFAEKLNKVGHFDSKEDKEKFAQSLENFRAVHAKKQFLKDKKKTEMKKEDTLMNKSLEKNGTLMGESSRKKK
tara:strand:+ start:335 stop:643 length:309 start_codon:yes stop_codon:yes gene_type:complete